MKKLISAVAAALASISVAVAMPLAAGAANSTTVVTPQNMNGWRFMDDQNDTEVGATGHMVTGPTNPPLGVGSAELETTSPTDGQALLKNAYGGKKLSAFTGLSYSTYVKTGNDTVAPALQMSVDKDVTDGNTLWQGRLVFEPYINTSTDNAPVTDGQWQTWNTVSGKWWLTKPALFNNACAQSSPCTWNELTSQFPNIGVNGGVNQQILFKVGSGWTSDFIGNVDALTVSFGSTGDTYDFEPYQTPTDANQCKKDNYKTYRDNTGMKFDNQGQCVSWVQHNVNGNGNGASNQTNSQTQ